MTDPPPDPHPVLQGKHEELVEEMVDYFELAPADEVVFEPTSPRTTTGLPHSSSLPVTFPSSRNQDQPVFGQVQDCHVHPAEGVEGADIGQTSELHETFSESPSEIGCIGKPRKKKVYIQRQFCFIVEVWPAPSTSVFGNTKVLTVKNKIQLLNETGFEIEYKQSGTPDPSDDGSSQYGSSMRLGAGMIQSSSRVGLHWDNADLKHEIVIRPASGPDGHWHWSGKFELPEKETYLGIKIRRKDRSEIKIIPVNITVGASGCILVTLKSDQSLPPYMVLNRCRDVVICLRQKAPDFSDEIKSIASVTKNEEGLMGAREALELRYLDRVGWDIFVPNSQRSQPIPFAWDEPSGQHVIQVVAAYATEEDHRARDLAKNQDSHRRCVWFFH